MPLLREHKVLAFCAGVGLATCASGSVSAAEASRGDHVEQLYVTRSSGALDCPDAPELASNVQARLGREALSPTTTPPTSGYWVQVDKSEKGYRASIRGVGALQGVREAADPGPTCQPLAEAIAVTMAILVDRPEAKPLVQPLPAGKRPEERSTHSAAVARQNQDVHPPTRWGHDIDERVVAGAGIAGLPTHATLALQGELHFAWARWTVGGGAIWIAPRSLSYGPGSVTVSHLAGYARACASAWRWQGGSLQGCLFPMVGVVEGQGHGYSPDRTSRDLWASLGPGAVFDTRLWGRLFWETRAVGLIPLRRQRYSLERGGAAYESPAAALLLASSLSLSIW